MSERKMVSLPYLFKKVARDVTGRTFPQPENWFGIPDDEYEELLTRLEN